MKHFTLFSLLLVTVCATAVLGKREIDFDFVWKCRRTTTSTTTEAPFRQCTPGEQTTMRCNGCFCDENGMWICTLMVCDDDPILIDVIEEGP